MSLESLMFHALVEVFHITHKSIAAETRLLVHLNYLQSHHRDLGRDLLPTCYWNKKLLPYTWWLKTPTDYSPSSSSWQRRPAPPKKLDRHSGNTHSMIKIELQIQNPNIQSTEQLFHNNFNKYKGQGNFCSSTGASYF